MIAPWPAPRYGWRRGVARRWEIDTLGDEPRSPGPHMRVSKASMLPVGASPLSAVTCSLRLCSGLPLTSSRRWRRRAIALVASGCDSRQRSPRRSATSSRDRIRGRVGRDRTLVVRCGCGWLAVRGLRRRKSCRPTFRVTVRVTLQEHDRTPANVICNHPSSRAFWRTSANAGKLIGGGGRESNPPDGDRPSQPL